MPQSAPELARLTLIAMALIGFLSGCGQMITITLPGSGTGFGIGTDRTLPDRYGLLLSPAPHAYRRALAPEPVRRGAASERYELRDGDCGGSDCGNFRARAEIAEIPERAVARLDRDVWYGWSFYNETITAVTRQTALNTVVGQWRLDGDQPSILRLIQLPQGEGDWDTCDPAICNRGGAPGDDVVVQLDEMRQTFGWGPAQNNGNICRLWSIEGNRGRWVDIVLNTNFGTDGFGYLRIWVNGELKCNYAGQLVSAERARTPVPGPANRRGIFQSFTRAWTQAQGATPKPTLIAYYDEFLVGLSRADVDTRLREQTGQPPVN